MQVLQRLYTFIGDVQMSEKLTLVIPSNLGKELIAKTAGKYLSRQQFILEAVREKLSHMSLETMKRTKK